MSIAIYRREAERLLHLANGDYARPEDVTAAHTFATLALVEAVAELATRLAPAPIADPERDPVPGKDFLPPCVDTGCESPRDLTYTPGMTRGVLGISNSDGSEARVCLRCGSDVDPDERHVCLYERAGAEWRYCPRCKGDCACDLHPAAVGAVPL